MEYTITKNTQFNSLEVSFEGLPEKAIRDALKGLKYRWHGVKKVWYGYSTEDELKAALNGEKKASEPKVIENYLGVKVGDVFKLTWGYDQTQNDFFQVVEIVGSKKVRVNAVLPPYEATAISGMSEDRDIKIDGSMLPIDDRSIFITDHEHGDIKLVQEDNWSRAGEVRPQIKVGHHHANMFKGGRVYESWYR